MNSYDYFIKPGQMTDPGKYAEFYLKLKPDLSTLCKIVQGLCIHVFWADHYGVTIPPDRMGELQIRDTSTRIGRILIMSQAPLIQSRNPQDRIVSNCRHFSVTLVSFLRYLGIPARARCGFAAYFLPDHYEDHWVCEYWNHLQKRWIFVDPQLDEIQSDALKFKFDPLDVPRDQFITAGRAWLMCRKEGVDPNKFGIFDMLGLGFVRGNLVRDIASLNNMELLPWDCWGMILHESLDDPNDLAILDKAAELSCGDSSDMDQIHSLYLSNPGLKTSHQILSYVNGQMIPVTI